MKTYPSHNRLIAVLLGVALFAFAGLAAADPPARVARLGHNQRRRDLFPSRR